MANEFSEKTAETNSVKCKDCGANLKYLPGTPYLNCEYCGAKNEIEQVTQVEIIENDYESFLMIRLMPKISKKLALLNVIIVQHLLHCLQTLLVLLALIAIRHL